jgi:periplasmic protein TonB
VAIQSPPVPPHAKAGPASDKPAPGPIRAHLTYLRAPPPHYPTYARRARMQGTVILRVLVDAGGHPVQVQVEHSSGHPVLDRAARRQVAAKWLFKPAQVKGQATPAWALVPVQFRLRSY